MSFGFMNKEYRFRDSMFGKQILEISDRLSYDNFGEFRNWRDASLDERLFLEFKLRNIDITERVKQEMMNKHG